VQVRGLARQEMFRRQRHQIIGGILQLHRMSLFSDEIDCDLIKKKIPFGNSSETPALMETKRARLQLFQLLRCLRIQLSRFDDFFQFRIHSSRTSYDEDFASREKSLAPAICDCG